MQSIISGSKKLQQGITPYVAAAKKAKELGIGINAGHDLDLHNLKYFKQNISWIDEVSIGHALICDSIYSLDLKILFSYIKDS